jgi:hypothetical protein
VAQFRLDVGAEHGVVAHELSEEGPLFRRRPDLAKNKN